MNVFYLTLILFAIFKLSIICNIHYNEELDCQFKCQSHFCQQDEVTVTQCNEKLLRTTLP